MGIYWVYPITNLLNYLPITSLRPHHPLRVVHPLTFPRKKSWIGSISAHRFFLWIAKASHGLDFGAVFLGGHVFFVSEFAATIFWQRKWKVPLFLMVPLFVYAFDENVFWIQWDMFVFLRFFF